MGEETEAKEKGITHPKCSAREKQQGDFYGNSVSHLMSLIRFLVAGIIGANRISILIWLLHENQE